LEFSFSARLGLLGVIDITAVVYSPWAPRRRNSGLEESSMTAITTGISTKPGFGSGTLGGGS